MPDLDNDILEMEDISSIKDEADASQEVEQSADAASSTAPDVSKSAEPDTLSIVRDVVAKTDDAAASSAKEAAGDGQEAASAGTAKEPDNENFSDVPFNKHPRFQEVLGKLRTAEQDAVRYRNVETFISEQGLGAEEAADLLRIGGMMKTNPVEAWKLAKPTIQKLLIAAGEVLPDDLKQRVQSGEMSPEVAMEVSRNRASLQSQEARTNFERQQAQTRSQREVVDAIQSEVASWESERNLRDPNFAAKMPAIEKEIVWLQKTEGVPNTKAGVRQQLDKAYNAVSATFQSPKPQQKPTRQPITPVTGGQVNGNVREAPKSTVDIIRARMAQRTA